MLNVPLAYIFFADIQNRTFDITRLLFVCFAYINVVLKKFSFIFSTIRFFAREICANFFRYYH